MSETEDGVREVRVLTNDDGNVTVYRVHGMVLLRVIGGHADSGERSRTVTLGASDARWFAAQIAAMAGTVDQ